MLALIEIGVMVILTFVLVTQVFVPLFRGRKLFPAFRESELQKEAQAIREDAEAAKEISRITQELKDLAAKHPEMKDRIDEVLNNAVPTKKEKQ